MRRQARQVMVTWCSVAQRNVMSWLPQITHDFTRCATRSHCITRASQEEREPRRRRAVYAMSLQTTDATANTQLRVLVAEPDSEARRSYADALRPLRCDVIEAADGREALVAALVRRPSLIVLESRLPLLNGPSLCEILRRDVQTRGVPIVALAGDPAEREVERLHRAGANSVLVKPVAPDALVSELRRLARTESKRAPLAPAASDPPPPPASGARRKRLAKSKQHVRCTTTNPPTAPPILRCPMCDGPLLYQRSHLGGVSHRLPEQWDDFLCPACGTFEYRHRTRKLRELAD